jgi:predicted acetyltransferase
MNLELVPANAADRPAIDNLLQLYIHDFSEHWAGRSEGELLDTGRFPDYPLDKYWSDPGCVPLLLRVDGKLAGFALLNQQGHVGRPVDRNMAEFFVVRKHRRAGLGRIAAHQIFTRYPGQWEVAVARRNVAALAFWRRVIGQHPLAIDIDETDVVSTAWNGPLIRFRVRPLN